MAVSVDRLTVPEEKVNAPLSGHTKLDRSCQTAVGLPDSQGFVSGVCDSRRCRIKRHDIIHRQQQTPGDRETALNVSCGDKARRSSSGVGRWLIPEQPKDINKRR